MSLFCSSRLNSLTIIDGICRKRILIDSIIYKDNLLLLKNIITFLCKDVADLVVCLASFELVLGDAS